MSVLPTLGGGIFGAVIKLWSLSQQDKARRDEMLIQRLGVAQDNSNQANEHASKNERFSIVRSIIALSIVSVLVGAFWFEDVTIPVTSTVGGEYLFGLIDTTKKVTEYISVDRVVLDDLLQSFQFIIGTYFGQNLARRG